ncbi:MAG: 3-isopropylmalate dehydratase small subunit [Kofleriaceae bacterium]
MEPFGTVRARAIPLAIPNIDTDRIKPARFGLPSDVSYAPFMLYDLRFDEQGQSRDSVFEQAAYAGAQILVADDNFGCGSSRESAVWCLRDYGFRVVIAPSFGDIFFGNCFKKGILPIVLPPDVVATLRTALTESPGAEVVVELESQTVQAPGGDMHGFTIDAFRKACLGSGVDDFEMTARHASAIDDYEATTPAWITGPIER